MGERTIKLRFKKWLVTSIIFSLVAIFAINGVCWF